jgi:endonuclease-3 related protein
VKAFGPQSWWPAATRFEVILGAYLTQNTSWKAVERSLANLRQADALTLKGFRAVSLDRLQEMIRPSGFHTRKAPALRAFVDMLDNEFAGSLEQLASAPTAALRKRLLALPSVGPETADAILLYALNHPVPVADEYLRRIAVRHGLVRPDTQGYDALAQLTRETFRRDPPEVQSHLFNEFHALTVAVGKAYCGRNAHCDECPLAADLRRLPTAAAGGASKQRRAQGDRHTVSGSE